VNDAASAVFQDGSGNIVSDAVALTARFAALDERRTCQVDSKTAQCNSKVGCEVLTKGFKQSQAAPADCIGRMAQPRNTERDNSDDFGEGAVGEVEQLHPSAASEEVVKKQPVVHAPALLESDGPDRLKVKYVKESIYVQVDAKVHTVKHLRAVLCGLTGVEERLQKLLCAGRTLLPLVDGEPLANVGVKNGSVLMMTASRQSDIDLAERASHCLLSKTGRKKLNKEWFSKEPEPQAADEDWIAGTAASALGSDSSSNKKKSKKKR
jgi:hypothetical protein